jgi:TPR repeat protein
VDALSAFQVLELQVGASAEEVKKAYRTLCKVWHPDRFAEPEMKEIAERRQIQLNEAYRTLRDGPRTAQSGQHCQAAEAGPKPSREAPASRERFHATETTRFRVRSPSGAVYEWELASLKSMALHLAGRRPEPHVNIQGEWVPLGEALAFLGQGPPVQDRAAPDDSARSAATVFFEQRAKRGARDNRWAFDLVREAAGKGDPDAQVFLGRVYAAGGVGINRDEAIRWYGKTAAHPSTVLLALGELYSTGLTLPRDESEAARWFRSAAAQGHPEGEFHLAFAYLRGAGVPKSEADAVRSFRKAADKGYAPAQYCLGQLHTSGSGVRQDDSEAVRWYRKAAEQAYAPAQTKLGMYLGTGTGVPADLAEAMLWLRRAAEQGEVEAQYLVGLAYESGGGVRRNSERATFWFRKAAQQGHGDAKRKLDNSGSRSGGGGADAEGGS